MKGKLYLSAILICSITCHVCGQAGSYVSGFRNGGSVVTNISGALARNENTGRAVVQGDGKILVATLVPYATAVYRYNADGSLDNSFSGDGVAYIYSINCFSILVQPDGKIVVGGNTNNGGTVAFGMERLNPDGSTDVDFGENGKVVTAIGTIFNQINSLVLQTDGKIIAGGSTNSVSGYAFAVARYNSDGSLDNSFDGDGKVTTDIGTSNNILNAIALQTDGKIIAGGYSYTGSGYSFAVARFNSDGSLDNSFDGDGKLTTAVGTVNDGITSIAIQSDGKVVAGGYSYTGSGYAFALTRYNSDGSLDNSFDGDGKVTTAIGTNNDQITAIAVQPDDKIIAGGKTYTGSGYAFALARYNSDGSLDNSFDGDGIATRSAGTVNEIFSIALQSDGKIIAAGDSYLSDHYACVLLRLDADGAADNSFDEDGVAYQTHYFSIDDVRSMVLQTDGKIVVAGNTYTGTGYSFALARYNTDGGLDNSFAGDGLQVLAFNGTYYSQLTSLALQPDGKIVAGGNTYTGSSTVFAVARFNSDGSLDNNFDGDGKVTTAIGTSNDQITAITVQPDGKIVAGGFSYTGSGYVFALARYNNDGSLDNSFDGDGKLTTAIGTSVDQITAIAVQPDGKIVAGGYTNTGTGNAFAIARYNSDGSLDNSFDGDGKVTTAIGTSVDQITAITVQPDGKIVAGGFSYTGSGYVFALARYNNDGSLDNSFDGDGKVITTIGTNNDQIRAINLQSDGKILAFGSSYNGSTYRYALARYNSDGSLDNSFDDDGKMIVDPLGTNEIAQAMQLSDNLIYLAGTGYTENDQDFLVTALLNDASQSPLPLTLLTFDGRLQQHNALLHWTTADENNVDGFSVERSTDGRNFSSVGFVRALNTAGNHPYAFTDYNATALGAPVLYYRLRLTDFDGKSRYSGIVALPVKTDAGKAVILYPNPATNLLNLSVASTVQDHISWQVTDAAGKTVLAGNRSLAAGSNNFSVNISRLQAGLYMISINGAGMNQQIRFIKE